MPSKSEIIRCQEKKSREKSGCDLLIHTLIWAACLESDKYGLPKNARFVNFCTFFEIFFYSKIHCVYSSKCIFKNEVENERGFLQASGSQCDLLFCWYLQQFLIAIYKFKTEKFKLNEPNKFEGFDHVACKNEILFDSELLPDAVSKS